ncbi:unnamed protein product [marine sediment metagenome]|uniref:Uncharacterized protein n=1 Tax=marine sediment metagenome TaxID=412755 RepID=X1RY66_9ZZZZ
MDLKDVVSSVYANAAEAHKAFHAGHHDTAEEYLKEISVTLAGYWTEENRPSAVVAEQATREKQDETLAETPVEEPGAPAQPAAVDLVAPASEVLPASQLQTPPQ